MLPAHSSSSPAAAAHAPPPPLSVRCLRVSPDGRHLAAGDSRGTLRVYELASFRQLLQREAHEGEILDLSYSPLPAALGRDGGVLDGAAAAQALAGVPMYLATASRDGGKLLAPRLLSSWTYGAVVVAGQESA